MTRPLALRCLWDPADSRTNNPVTNKPSGARQFLGDSDLVSGDIDVRHEVSDAGAQVLQEAMWNALLFVAHLHRFARGAESLQPLPLFPKTAHTHTEASLGTLI